MSIDRMLALVTLTVMLAGCSAPVAYRPDEEVLHAMTRDQREQIFVETISRASKPRIYQVWIDDVSYGYDSAVAVRDGFGIPVGDTGRRRIVYFANVRELRLYENDAVFVVDTNGRTVDKLDFAYREDAQRMMDLIAAYRANRYAGAGSPAGEPRRHEPRPYQRPPRERVPPPYDPRYDRPPPDYDDDDRYDDRRPY